jgi:hypothetical protein
MLALTGTLEIGQVVSPFACGKVERAFHFHACEACCGEVPSPMRRQDCDRFAVLRNLKDLALLHLADHLEKSVLEIADCHRARGLHAQQEWHGLPRVASQMAS